MEGDNLRRLAKRKAPSSDEQEANPLNPPTAVQLEGIKRQCIEDIEQEPPPDAISDDEAQSDSGFSDSDGSTRPYNPTLDGKNCEDGRSEDDVFDNILSNVSKEAHFSALLENPQAILVVGATSRAATIAQHYTSAKVVCLVDSVSVAFLYDLPNLEIHVDKEVDFWWFSDNSFDLICLQRQYGQYGRSKNWPRFWNDVFRILKPGGVCESVEMTPSLCHSDSYSNWNELFEDYEIEISALKKFKEDAGFHTSAFVLKCHIGSSKEDLDFFLENIPYLVPPGINDSHRIIVSALVKNHLKKDQKSAQVIFDIQIVTGKKPAGLS